MDIHCQMYHEKQISVFSGFNDIRLKDFALKREENKSIDSLLSAWRETDKTGVLFLICGLLY